MKQKRERIAAVLLGGGTAGRLGFSKEMLRVDGAPLGVRMVQRLREVFDSVLVVSNEPEYLRHCVDVPIYRDVYPHEGPLAGLHAGLTYADTARCFFLACDMPLVHQGIVRRMVERAVASGAPAVLASARGRLQPLCGVYSVELLPALEQCLAAGGERSVMGFLDAVTTEVVEFGPPEDDCFRDIDEPDDLWLLGKVFGEVEPLPVRIVPLPGDPRERDVVVEEWPVVISVNSLKLATVLCLPTSLRELAIGLSAYLGLVKRAADVQQVDVDYTARRVGLRLDVEDSAIRRSVQLLITSTCGSNVYGGEMPRLPDAASPGRFRVRLTHVIECIHALRRMGPVFGRTGGTHGAAFSDGRGIRLFFEDIGRHNAVDKVIGSALRTGVDLRRGVLISSGRLSSEMVVKAARQAIPVVASRSAVTSNAIELARKYGITFVGFARGGRANVYTAPERVMDG